MRRYLLIGATLVLLAIPALAFGRATTTVQVGPNGSFSFSPKNVTKTVGAGAITWRWNGFSHNVRQDVKLFYSGQLANAPHTFSVIPSAGSFHYYCELHGTRTSGMNGTIKIRPQTFNKTASSFGVRWSTGSNDTGGKFDVRYRVDGGSFKVWKNDVAATQATFGAGNSPVDVAPGHTYDVQVRSEKASNTSQASDWSPAARVTT